MLPMTLQFVIAMVASAVNDRLQRRLGYLEEEVAVLRELLASASGTKRPRFTLQKPESARRRRANMQLRWSGDGCFAPSPSLVSRRSRNPCGPTQASP